MQQQKHGYNHAEATDEHKHYMKCPACGKEFDMRDLTQVAEHMHNGTKIDPEAAKKIRARRIGEPVEWQDGELTFLN